MLQKIKKYRGILTLGLALMLIGGFFTIDASASSRYYSTSPYNSTATENYNDKYYLKTEYHFGTSAPMDNAYVYAEAGGRYGMLLYRYYDFQSTKNRDRLIKDYQNRNLDSRMIYCHSGYELPDDDYGYGKTMARVYPAPGWGIDNIDEKQYLSIDY